MAISKEQRIYKGRINHLKEAVKAFDEDYPVPPSTLSYLRRKITAAHGLLTNIESTSGHAFLGTAQVELSAALEIIDEALESPQTDQKQNKFTQYQSLDKLTVYDSFEDIPKELFKPGAWFHVKDMPATVTPTKPPIGLKSKQLHDAERLCDITTAISHAEPQDIEEAWVLELISLANDVYMNCTE